MKNNCQLFIGCVSINTIDAAIEYSNENNVYLGLIPSRRQVDAHGGYINFNNKLLYDYVKNRSNKIILQRDHGGPNQGTIKDDGVISLLDDCKYYDILHIDPWIKYTNFQDGLECTKQLIQSCMDSKYNGTFEIGTEESIFSFELHEMDTLIQSCKKYNIEYVVIQSGTSLSENKNTGTYNKNKLINFLNLVKKYNLKTKEHNGDYINSDIIREKFNLGLNGINIAPEFGFIETCCYLEALSKDSQKINIFYDLCYESGRWKKWVNSQFNIEDKLSLIKICGHYLLDNEIFKTEIKYKIPDISVNIKSKIKDRIHGIIL